MLVTDETSHVEILWLKDSAKWNIISMLMTADTFQADKSWLKCCASPNISSMSETADTSHSPIAPCTPAEQFPIGDSLMHSSTALWSSVLFRGANAAIAATSKAFGQSTESHSVYCVQVSYNLPPQGFGKIRIIARKIDSRIISAISALSAYHYVCIRGEYDAFRWTSEI